MPVKSKSLDPQILAADIRKRTVRLTDHRDFPELAICALVRSYTKRGLHEKATRLVEQFIAIHGRTPAILAL